MKNVSVDSPPAPRNRDDVVSGGQQAAWEQTSNSSNGDESSNGGSPERSQAQSPQGVPPSLDDIFNTEAPASWWKGQEDIVISGVSGRMPQSDNLQEFADNLYNGVDMVTEDSLRWTPGLYDLPRRHAKIKNYERMDAGFFGVTPKQANVMDPQLRILLEVAYEAILDSGYSPQTLKNYRVGCFVGCSGSEMSVALTRDPETIVGYSLTGTTRSMFANRLSFAFDFRGPSFAVDTACSSSLLALQLAVDSIRKGECEAALVAGANLTLAPTTSLQFHRLTMLSPQGKCQSFDANGDGYVRAEAIGAVLLQKASDARRVYCTVVHAKSSTDGTKSEGITFPSGYRQGQLLVEVYREAGVHPHQVKYIECHGTGTKVGDPQEANAICEIFCRDRDDTLLIGSVKSNMGHAEPASGVASLCKLMIAMEKGLLPGNLHFTEPNPYIPGLMDGRLTVVEKTTPFPDGYISVNSFGFGGSNTHALLKPYKNEKSAKNIPKPKFMRMICFSGRTQEAVETQMKFMESRPDDYNLPALLADEANLPTNLCPYRGYTILNRSPVLEPLHEISKVPTTEKRQVWFIFSGMGSQWPGMARDLMCIDVFRNTLQRCSDTLMPYGMNVMDMIMNGDEEVFKSTNNCFSCICAIQIALTDLLKSIGVEPDGIIGHSTGEMACGYADGCTTVEETMLVSYHRGKAILGAKLPPGAMAAIGMTKEEVLKRAPKGVWFACHNANDSVSISGDEDAVLGFVDDLTKDGGFAKAVNSAGIAFHSPYMQRLAPAMLEGCKGVIKKPKMRSPRWVTTSVTEDKLDTDLAKYCSAEYHVNNLTSPVLFHEALQKVPPHAVAVEIGPHMLLNAILRRGLPSTCTSFGLTKKGHENNLEFLLQNLGKMHAAGVNLNIENLYPKVPFPVARGTPMISPLIRWDHSQNWNTIDLEDIISFGSPGKPVSIGFNVDPFAPEAKDAYLLDHVIDGRALFPFTGYLVLAWRGATKVRGLDYENVPVVIENVRVLRATLLSKPTKFYLSISFINGDFEIVESDSVCCTGKITMLDEEGNKVPFFYEKLTEQELASIDPEAEEVELQKTEIYKELQLRGYEYGPHFRGINKMSNTGRRFTLGWNGNWISFLDTLLQGTLLAERSDTLRLPVRMRYLRIDPKKHVSSVQEEDDNQVIRVLCDHSTQGCIAGGIEMQEVVAQSTTRRLHAAGKPTLERVYFHPFVNDECFKEDPKLRQEVLEYNTLCKNYVIQGLKQLVKATKLPNAATLEKVASEKAAPVDEQALKKALADPNPNCGLIKMLNKIFTEKPNADQLAQIVQEEMPNLDQDKLCSAMWTDFPVKPFLDSITESQAGHHLRMAAVEPASIAVPKTLRGMQRSHPLLEADWTLVAPNADEIADAEELEQNGMETFNYDINAEEAPTMADKYKNYDVVVLDRVLHKKADVQQYLERVMNFVRDDGFLLVNEVTDNFETAFTVLALQGEVPSANLNGARKYGVFYDHDSLCQMFKKAGLRVVGSQTDKVMTTLYLLRKAPTKPRQPVFQDIDDVKEFSWLKPLQTAIEERLDAPPEDTIWLTSTNVQDNGTLGLGLCLRDELSRARMHVLMESSVKSAPKKLDLKSPEVQNIIENSLHSNVYRDGKWGTFQHIVVKENQMLAYKETEHAFINTLVRGDLSSLNWVESPNGYWKSLPTTKKTDDLCQVYYASLNFRDIMLASGRLPPDAIPGDFTDRECLLGMEFSGRLSSNGKRIMAILPAQAMATTAVVDPAYTWDVPDNWSLEDAATVPVAFTTAYYALIVRGKLKKGDKTLIHSGSGGVGLAAIGIALSVGAEVYTTVSSEEKKRFVQKRYPQMKDHHFSNSRTTEFEYHVMHQTKGKGVDVILNSLSDDKLQASVRCLAQHGRFCEIGKFDLSNNSALGMAVFLKNATFHGILLDAFFGATADTEEWKRISTLFQDGLAKGVVKPLNAATFASDKVEEAFRYMAQGKHMGKVLLKLRDEEPQKTVLPKPMKVRAVCRTLCHPQHSYLITGGLGGFGLELTQWLISRGARNVVLSSRSGVRNGYQARCLLHWRRAGVKVVVSNKNIADAQQTTELIKECQQLGPLGGVFHLAMVLRDCLFENQTVKNFKEAAEAKYTGTKNLDNVTRKMCKDELRWFAVWSSISCGRGNNGQTNYGWANSTMERIVEKRRADGLAGIAIRWGAIGDVGVVLENMGDNNTVIGGTLPQRMPSCLQTLDTFLSWNHPLVSSFVRADMESSRNKSKGGDPVQAIAHILGVSDVSQLDADASFGDLGLDSLMGVEIKQALERDYDIVLSMKDIRAMTVNKLREMAKSGGGAAAAAIAKETPKEESAEGTDAADDSDKDKQVAPQKDVQNLFAIFRLRIDLSSLKPDKSVIQLNKVTQGKPVFCIPSIEGVGAPLATLAAKLPFPVYSVQAVTAAPQDTIEKLAAFYTQEIKRIQPKGPYRIIGYSYGACIGLEMATGLQQQNPSQPNIVESLILLDGSHRYMQTYRNAWRKAYGVGDQDLGKNAVVFETEVLCAFTMRVVPVDYEQLRSELFTLPNYQARLDNVVKKVMSSGLPVKQNDIEFAADALCKKIKAADLYDPKTKFNGDINLIRAETGTAREEDVGKDYSLHEVTNGKVNVHVVSGDHDTFVQGRGSDKTASIISAILSGNAPSS